MKRILLVSALLLCTICAKGQIILGGQIGLTPGRDGNGIGINIAPEIGYSFNRYLTAGAYLSYQSRYNTFGATPYLRCNIVTFGGIVRLFATATAPMRFASMYKSFGANIRPGVSVRVANNLSLMAHIGTFGYLYTDSAGVISSGWIARLNSENISLGFCFDIW